MLFSIIIPLQNQKQYIRKCLASAINQTLSNEIYEIIVVDDKSNDGSLKIVKKIFKGRKNCKLLKTDINTVGAGNARNCGLKNSKGKYIYFLDSDDFLHKETLRKLREIISRNKNVDLICNNYLVIDRNKNMKKKDRFDLELLKSENEKVIENFFNLSIIPQVISNLFKKELLIKKNINFKQGYFEDVYYFFRVLLYSKKKIILKEKLYYKHNRKGSVVNTLTPRHISDAFKGYTSAYNLLKKGNKSFFLYYLYMKAIVGETAIIISRIKYFKINKIDKIKYYKHLYDAVKKYVPWLFKKYRFVTKKDLIFRDFVENKEIYF